MIEHDFSSVMRSLLQTITRPVVVRNEGKEIFVNSDPGCIAVMASSLDAVQMVKAINARLGETKITLIDTDAPADRSITQKPENTDRNSVLQDRLNTVIDHYLSRKARQGSPINQELIEIKNDAAGEVFKTWRK